MWSTMVWLVLLTLLTLKQVSAEPTVSSSRTQVIYQGIVSNSVEHFENIKYAYETSGKRRFAPPEPFQPPPNTTIDATSRGAACPQLQNALPPQLFEEKVISEDCLSLRIARPQGVSSDSKLPIVVWVHGGGVIKGLAYDAHFDPENLINLSVASGKPIIYVAINYRLTMFGFAHLPILKDQKSLNIGLRDQREGFQWVKDNIEAFGGDSEKITAFGQSAGATSVSLHPLLYGGSQGVPFDQAWMMSGPPGTATNLTSNATTGHTMAVAAKAGCGNSSDTNPKTLECLRRISMPDLLNAAMNISIENHPPMGIFTFIPTLDDDLIPDRPSNMMTAGNFVKGIPMVFGWCQEDTTIYVGPGPLMITEDDMIKAINAFASGMSQDQLSTLFALYPATDFDSDVENYDARRAPSDPVVTANYFRVSRILRDLLFSCSSIEFGFQMTKHTRAIDPEYDGVRLYVFNQTMLGPFWNASEMPYVGVAHASDINYIFDGVFPEGNLTSEDVKLSDLMSKSLINFAYTGNPNEPDSYAAEWPSAYLGPKGKFDLSEIVIEVLGGPYGGGSVTVHGSGTTDSSTEIGNLKLALSDVLNFGSNTSEIRDRLVRKEKLLERCAYVRSLAEALGV